MVKLSHLKSFGYVLQNSDPEKRWGWIQDFFFGGGEGRSRTQLTCVTFLFSICFFGEWRGGEFKGSLAAVVQGL